MKAHSQEILTLSEQRAPLGLEKLSRINPPHQSPASGTNLFQPLGVEAGQRIVLHRIGDLNWIAADFTVFHVALTAD
jgi:hypothetical protein